MNSESSVLWKELGKSPSEESELVFVCLADTKAVGKGLKKRWSGAVGSNKPESFNETLLVSENLPSLTWVCT